MENKNIFENAKFGDKYLTKRGHVVLFSRFVYYKGNIDYAVLIREYEEKMFANLDGTEIVVDGGDNIVKAIK